MTLPAQRQVGGAAEWHRAQVDQAAETFRFLVGLTTAVWSFLIGADAALAVYAASAREAEALWVAAVMPAVCCGVWIGLNRSLITLAFIALRSELALGGPQPGIVQTYGQARLPELEARLREMTQRDPDEALEDLKVLSRGTRVGPKVTLFLVALTAAQLGAAMWATLNW